jgi:hypothetical protein
MAGPVVTKTFHASKKNCTYNSIFSLYISQCYVVMRLTSVFAKARVEIGAHRTATSS